MYLEVTALRLMSDQIHHFNNIKQAVDKQIFNADDSLLIFMLFWQL